MLIAKTTCESRKEAEKIGLSLVKEKLAACASVYRCKSFFFWKGKMRKENEFVLELKVRDAAYRRLERRLKELHSHELPQIIAVKVARAGREYAAWVERGKSY